MPELPEVEIARRQLTRWLAGQRIARIAIPDPSVIRPTLRSRGPWPEGIAQVQALAGQVAEAPIRHGKRLGWRFTGAPVGLLVHFGMTGSWTRGEAPPPHGRLGLIGEAQAVWLTDPRRFGAVTPVPADALEDRLAEGLGPDALDAALDGPALRQRVGRRGAIKTALMDQQRIAGLGNIQSAEALWRAQIAPTRPAATLTEAEWARLAVAIVEQLRLTVERDDGDELVYATLGGPNPFQVYKREGDPCPRCGTPIQREMQGGRATFSCPVCQPA